MREGFFSRQPVPTFRESNLTTIATSVRFKISFAEHSLVPTCAGKTTDYSKRFKPLSAYLHLSPERERAKKQITASCNMLHAICSLLSGLADFRRKKHGNLCSSLHNPTAQGRIKRERWE
jgi:hypothetical protein